MAADGTSGDAAHWRAGGGLAAPPPRVLVALPLASLRESICALAEGGVVICARSAVFSVSCLSFTRWYFPHLSARGNVPCLLVGSTPAVCGVVTRRRLQ